MKFEIWLQWVKANGEKMTLSMILQEDEAGALRAAKDHVISGMETGGRMIATVFDVVKGIVIRTFVPENLENFFVDYANIEFVQGGQK